MLSFLKRSLLACAFLACAPAWAQITVVPATGEPSDTPSPQLTVGEDAVITLDQPAASVQVVWRPNSAIPDTVALDASGATVAWTPDRAGVATIVTPEATQNVSVRYDALPGLGLFILVGAGLVLFGGAGFAMRALMSGDDIPELPLDT